MYTSANSGPTYAGYGRGEPPQGRGRGTPPPPLNPRPAPSSGGYGGGPPRGMSRGGPSRGTSRGGPLTGQGSRGAYGSSGPRGRGAGYGAAPPSIPSRGDSSPYSAGPASSSSSSSSSSGYGKPNSPGMPYASATSGSMTAPSLQPRRAAPPLPRQHQECPPAIVNTPSSLAAPSQRRRSQSVGSMPVPSPISPVSPAESSRLEGSKGAGIKTKLVVGMSTLKTKTKSVVQGKPPPVTPCREPMPPGGFIKMVVTSSTFGKGHTDYIIDVETNLPQFPDPSFRVKQRYSGFEKLHSSLKLMEPGIPVMPLKDFFSRFSEDVIRQRVARFGEILDFVASRPMINRCPALLHFLHIPWEK